MKKLLKGLHKFQSSYFPKNQEIFTELAEGQKPRVLFITCSDSRIVPHLMVVLKRKGYPKASASMEFMHLLLHENI